LAKNLARAVRELREEKGSKARAASRRRRRRLPALARTAALR
jgi:hypothetical protein